MFDNLTSIFSYNIGSHLGRQMIGTYLNNNIYSCRKVCKQFCQALNLFGRSLYPIY